MKITAYFMAPVRGRAGEDVDAETKAANVAKGVEVGRTIRGWFDELDLYIPHENEEVIDILWQSGIAGEEIVAAYSVLAARRKLGIVYTGNGISVGMATEIAAMTDSVIVYVEDLSDATREKITKAIWEVKSCPE